MGRRGNASIGEDVVGGAVRDVAWAAGEVLAVVTILLGLRTDVSSRANGVLWYAVTDLAAAVRTLDDLIETARAVIAKTKLSAA